MRSGLRLNWAFESLWVAAACPVEFIGGVVARFARLSLQQTAAWKIAFQPLEPRLKKVPAVVLRACSKTWRKSRFFCNYSPISCQNTSAEYQNRVPILESHESNTGEPVLLKTDLIRSRDRSLAPIHARPSLSLPWLDQVRDNAGLRSCSSRLRVPELSVVSRG